MLGLFTFVDIDVDFIVGHTNVIDMIYAVCTCTFVYKFDQGLSWHLLCGSIVGFTFMYKMYMQYAADSILVS